MKETSRAKNDQGVQILCGERKKRGQLTEQGVAAVKGVSACRPSSHQRRGQKKNADYFGVV